MKMRVFRKVPFGLGEKVELSVPVSLHPNRERKPGRRHGRSRAKSRDRLQVKRFAFWQWDKRTLIGAPFKNAHMRRDE